MKMKTQEKFVAACKMLAEIAVEEGKLCSAGSSNEYRLQMIGDWLSDDSFLFGDVRDQVYREVALLLGKDEISK